MKDNMTDVAARPAVVIRGMGVYCPLGTNCEELELAVLEQRDSIGPVTSFDASPFLSDHASAFGAEVAIEMASDEAAWMDRATLFTIAAYREALERAALDLSAFDPTRIAVCLGSSHSGLVRTEDVARSVLDGTTDSLDPKVIAATFVSHCTAIIKRMAGAKGRILTVSSACASSNSAIGIAADLIRRGEADLAIAGGSDTVSLSVMAGFNALRALAPTKSAPFAQDIGLSIGEGAGIVILSREDLPGLLPSPPLAQVLGYGLSGDAHHATAPDQDGAGAVSAIIAALRDTALAPDDIDYVNAHGTGTEANDGAESRAIHRLFGDRVPVSSLKSYFGHTLGASGVIETIASILLARKGRVPANLRMEKPRDGCEALNYATSGSRIPSDAILLVNNFGFGGNNSSLVVRTGAVAMPTPRVGAGTDEVVITGMGSHSAAGDGIRTFKEALDRGVPLGDLDGESGVRVARIAPFRFTTPDLKPFARVSPAAKYVLTALRDALGDDRNVHAENPRSGLIGGVVFGAQKPTEKFMESVFLGDPALANAHYFPMITMNAIGGVASLAFGVKGYTTTLCGSASALSYAADLVGEDCQVRVTVVSGDELTPRLERIYHRAGVVSALGRSRAGRAAALGEFGGALTLERGSVARARGVPVVARLLGWATCQDPVDLSVSKSGEALIRAQNIALSRSGLSADAVTKVILIDRGLAPTSVAVEKALSALFQQNRPETLRPADVLGYAPSSGALMAVLAALCAPSGTTLATGYDVLGEAFAFVLSGENA